MTRRRGVRLFASLGLVGLLAVLASLASALGGGGSAATLGVLEEPVTAPALRGPALDGGVVDLEDHLGHVVLVNVWASWCAPCRGELPLLISAARRYGGQGLVVLGVNANDQRERARDFLDRIGAGDTVRHLYDPEGARAVEWGSIGLPQTFLVDRQGRIVARHAGPVTPAWLAEVVEPRLAS